MASAGLRVVQFWGRTALEDRTFSGLGSVTLGARGATLPLPPDRLPSKFPLFKRSLGGWHVALGPGIDGEIASSGAIKSTDDVLGAESAAHQKAKAPSRKAREHRLVKLQAGDWGFLRVGEHGFYFHLATPDHAHVGRQRRRDRKVLLSAIGWAFMLHALVLGMTFIFDPADLAGEEALRNYVVRITQPPLFQPKPPEEKKKAPQAGMVTGEKKQKPASTAGKEGKAGGKGNKPRMTAATSKTDPNPKDDLVKNVQDKGLLKHRGALSDIAGPDIGDRRLANAMARVGQSGGYGRGTGTGVGDGVAGTGTSLRGGSGSGGGGKSPHDFVSDRPIDTGTGRAAKGKPGGTGVSETSVGFSAGKPEGDFGGLTPEQVRKVVEAHRAVIAYCFNKELQRNPKLSGKVVMYWRISAPGAVTTAKVKSSTIGSPEVEDCLTRQVSKWKFPTAANGQETDVRYPFAFSAGR